MSWILKVWFGYSDRSTPAIVEELNTKNAGISRAQEILSDGYTVTGDVYHYFPASAITHIVLKEKEIVPEEE